ncbi:MAG: inorganic phosphate transporter family protein [Thermodesulfovibrionales bacterium]|nr:inorganic phosphate transporter family protein [Thermodesulfovibrionales bacterium]
MTELIPVAACFLIAFGIGSNDTSNALGICIGCGVIKLRRALIVFGCFVLIGILLQGQRVMDTVGKDLVAVNLPILSISLSVAALLIIVSNWKRLPLSTHQVIIGSLIGSAVASGAAVNFTAMIEIVVSWIVSPVVAFFTSLLLYKAMEKTISKLSLFRIEKILRTLLLFSGILIAYNTGANELATILGPVIHSGLIEQLRASLVGSLFVFLGAVILSHRVIETIGKGITTLDPYSGFAAQFGAGMCVLFFTSLGMPISTTYCIIGSISGVGMSKGMETVKFGLIRKIMANWVIAPSLAFLISFLIMRMVS